MERKTLRTICIIVMVVMALMLTACGTTAPDTEEPPGATPPANEPEQPANEPAGAPLKIGYLTATEALDYFILVNNGVKTWCEANGVELIYNVGTGEATSVRQSVESMVTQGANVIIDFSCLPDASTMMADWCAEQGVYYICVEMDAGENSYTYGVSNEQCGEVMGGFLADYINDTWGGQVDVIGNFNFPHSGVETLKRTDKALEVLKAEVTAVTDDIIVDLPCPVDSLDAARLKQIFTDFLTMNADKERIGIISYSSDTGSPALYAAVETTNMADKIAYVAIDGSIEAINLFKSGEPTVNKGEVCNFPDRYGADMGEMALRLHNGETLPKVTYVQNMMLTPENVNELYPVTPSTTQQ